MITQPEVEKSNVAQDSPGKKAVAEKSVKPLATARPIVLNDTVAIPDPKKKTNF